MIENRKLDWHDRHIKVKRIAENLERNALRREFIIKQKQNSLRNSTQKIEQIPGQKKVISNRPYTSGTSGMKRVDLSSVHYPSDASPNLNKDLNVLDRRVFGTNPNFVHWEKGKKLATG